MNYNPLFGTGLARSGGGLYSMCLSTHEEIALACCPNIELFRSLRNAMFRDLDNGKHSQVCGPEDCLQDWYGSKDKIAAFECLLESSGLNLEFNPSEWREFLEISISRGNLETADLTKNYNLLKGKTYKDIFDNLLSIIASTRGAEGKQWVGLHETWILEFYPMLAKAYPNAKFLVMLRDPRAIVSSMLGVEHIDPLQVAQVLSYVRHWRKYVALVHKFKQDPLFEDRLHVTSHELMSINPSDTISGICDFLGIPMDDRLLDTSNFFNPATGETWTGNSSFEAHTSGLSAHRAVRWKEKLSEEKIEFIEFLCGPELQWVGYPVYTKYASSSEPMTSSVLREFKEDYFKNVNWRSDFGDFSKDVGIELLRRAMICFGSSLSLELEKELFLTKDMYSSLMNVKRPLLPQLSILSSV